MMGSALLLEIHRSAAVPSDIEEVVDEIERVTRRAPVVMMRMGRGKVEAVESAMLMLLMMLVLLLLRLRDVVGVAPGRVVYRAALGIR